MKFDCPYCHETFKKSRLWLTLKYYLHTKPIYHNNFGDNQYQTTVTCPICQSKLSIIMYLRAVRTPSKDTKNKNNLEQLK